VERAFVVAKVDFVLMVSEAIDLLKVLVYQKIESDLIKKTHSG
jgi:hypothetical protein